MAISITGYPIISNWTSLKTVNGVLEKDYVHDFDLGPFILNNVLLNLSTGQVFLPETIRENIGLGGSSIVHHHITTNEFEIDQGFPKNAFGVRMLGPTNTDNPPPVLNDNITASLYPPNPAAFTRISEPLSGNANSGSIAGPYTLTFPTPSLPGVLAGSKYYGVSFLLYIHTRASDGGPIGGERPYQYGGFGSFAPFDTINSGRQVQVNEFFKPFFLRVLQKAVSVTKKDNSSGQVLATGTSLSNINIGDTLTLDKSNNRGDSVASEWGILKQDSSGVYVPATSGSDYQLNIGTLTSDLIEIQWLLGGQYKVINFSDGGTTTNPNPNIIPITSNTDESFLLVPVGIDPNDIIDTITLPQVLPVIIPNPGSQNTIISTNPLRGITPLTIQVSANIDIANASWTQKIPSQALQTFTLNQSQWQAELTSRVLIFCSVKKNGQFIDTKSGLGPHVFSLTEGTYEIGYLTTNFFSLGPITVIII